MASAKEIPPGGEGKIDVTFKTGTRGGKGRKNITVTTNDPERKTLKLTVSADVEIVLSTSPTRVNFGRLQKSYRPTAKYIALTGNAKDSVTITSVESKNEHIKVDVNPAGFENNKNKKIKIEVLPGLTVGKFRERITLHTDHETVKKLSLYVYGDIIGTIAVTPRYLSFGMLREGVPNEKTITLKAASEAAFKVLDVTSTIPEVETSLETIQEGKEYKVKAVIKQGFDKAILRGKILIQTDDTEQQNIEVNVFARKKLPPKKKGVTKKPQKFDQKTAEKKQ